MALIKRMINMKDIDSLINKFKSDELELYEYNKFENLSSPDFDVKYTLKIGKRINKNLKLILSTDEGIKKFIQLLDDDNIIIAGLAARYLYPIFPDRCMKIFKKYSKEAYDKLACKNVIEGLESRLPIFMQQFKDLYGEDRFEELSKL